jgi:hypothetical protein
VHAERLRRDRIGHQRDDHPVARVPAQSVFEVEADYIDPTMLEEVPFAERARQRDRLAPELVRDQPVPLSGVVGVLLDRLALGAISRLVVEDAVGKPAMVAIDADTAVIN